MDFDFPMETNVYIVTTGGGRGNSREEYHKFLYKPFVDTAFQLFKKYNCKYLHVNCANRESILSLMQENDIVIPIGSTWEKRMGDFFKQKVYMILYWTEPDPPSKRPGMHGIANRVDEIWLYSKMTFKQQPKLRNEQKIKFVPIINVDNVHLDYNKKNHNMKLCFFGALGARQNRLFPINRKKYFINKYDLWNDNDYNNFIINNVCIFLNVPKKQTTTLPYARICKLLSHRCIIISVPCNNIDDELFKDMIYFCQFNEIDKVFNNLLSKTPAQLDNIAGNFYNKFISKLSYETVQNVILDK